MTYLSKNKLLLSGGKKGEITVSDIRQRTIMHTFNGHISRIRSLAIDHKNGLLLSGSVDGELKIWDLETFTERHAWDVQGRNRFLNSGFDRIPPQFQVKSFGVTEIHVLDDGFIYTSGPNGIMRCRETPVTV